MRHRAAMDAILTRLRKDLPKNLFYHAVEHTLDVLNRVETLGKAEGIDDADLVLLQVAACYHDCGFLLNNRDHERLGCKIVKEELPKYDFTAEQIKLICGMIKATKIPQSPRNHLQRIICDADLDYLGRDDFYSIGNLLFKELKAYRVLETEEAWNSLQINFLSNHQYWTTTNQQEREAGKQARLLELKERWG